jgi:hypothetical protein
MNEKVTIFRFHIEGMTQSDADTLWDKILEGAEALGYVGVVVGTYEVITQEQLAELITKEGQVNGQ